MVRPVLILLVASPLALAAEGGGAAKPAEILVAADGSGAFRTIGEAVARAPSGATIRVKAGTYSEPLVLGRPVTILAAPGKERVVVEGAAGLPALSSSAEVSVEGIRLQGGPEIKGPAVEAEGGKLTLKACEISSLDGSGIRAVDAAVLLDGVTVLGCKGPGIQAGKGARIEARGGVLRHCGEYGLLLHDGAEAVLTKWQVAEVAGFGVILRGRSSARMTGCQVLDAGAAGLCALEESTVEGDDLEIARSVRSGLECGSKSSVVLRGSRVRAGKEAGAMVHDAGKARFEKCTFEGNANAGIDVRDEESTADATDCRFLGGRESGVLLKSSGKATLLKCDFEGNGICGVELRSMGEATIRECRITKSAWYGVSCKEGARGTVEKCDLRGNLKGAIYQAEPGALKLLVNRER